MAGWWSLSGASKTPDLGNGWQCRPVCCVGAGAGEKQCRGGLGRLASGVCAAWGGLAGPG